MAIFVLYNVFCLISAVSAALTVKWSGSTYGPDGPWHAVTVGVGTPPQNIDLYPGGREGMYVFRDAYCQSDAPSDFSPNCPASDSGLYDPNASTSANQDIDIPLVPNGWALPLFQDGVNAPVGDSVTVPFDGVDNPPIVPNYTLGVMQNGSIQYPFGNIPIGVGLFSLGGYHNITTAPLKDNTIRNGSFIPNRYFDIGVINSASFGLHLGSAVSSVPPSLIYGGYDQSRALQPLITNALGGEGGDCTLDLSSITIGSNEAMPPFNSSQMEQNAVSFPVSVGILPQTPYIWLPKQFCDTLASSLPLSYNESLLMYLWDESDPRYRTIVTGQNWLNFEFNGDSVIKVPFNQLALELTKPLWNGTDPQHYFPCYPHNTDTNFGLGRAFLQSAYYAVNWKPNDIPGTWWLAQAPGPGMDANVTRDIQNGDSTIMTSEKDWLSTWKGHWDQSQYSTLSPTPLSSTSSSAEATASNTGSGISGGAVAGIVVGVIVAVLLVICGAALILFRRRRAAKQSGANLNGIRKPQSHQPLPEMEGYRQAVEVPENPLRMELEANEREHIVKGQDEKDLPIRIHPHLGELPGS